MLGNLSKKELAELIRLLELGRRFSLDGAERCRPDGRSGGALSSERPVSCDGTKA